jgi:2-succinyl-5-enolpyruvyl-6-hydroxy-3-cyclohexene-1-carboxylate synthase
MPERILLSDKQGVNMLLHAAKHYGVEHVIIAPGSRNAPLAIAFSRSGHFHCHSIPDERVAAFYALGIALASRKAVIVMCTSGSASINFAPALAEAFYLGAAVIAVTADRPLSWTDQGNGQTIRQEAVFSNFTRGWFNLISEPKDHDDRWYNRRKLSELFNTALHTQPGPVHINVPLNEPLYGTAPQAEETHRFYDLSAQHELPDAGSVKKFAAKVAAARRIMILAGQMIHSDDIAETLQKWAEFANTAVLAETTSNIEGGRIITTIDRLIVSVYDEDQLQALMPDILITIGGFVVSKKIKALLRKFSPSEHWHISLHDQGLDTYQSLTDEIKAQPDIFLKSLTDEITDRADSNYASLWAELAGTRAARHKDYTGQVYYSDFQVFHHLHSLLPQGICLHMANSSPVRYVQLFGTRADIQYHCNRGTSGIDGCTSTAAGWALARPDKDVVLVTGDMAFMYDSNALWNRSLPQNLKIIIVNNQGGGIFRIIEGPAEAPELEEFYEAHHPANLERMAQVFDLPYYRAVNEGELLQILPRFFAKSGCAVLEIFTPRYENAGALKAYFQALRD